MQATAVILRAPERLELSRLALDAPGEGDLVVDVAWSGISTGTERLLYSGRMPAFPGMGYPLVPGYESVGHVVQAGTDARHVAGDFVFVPGARCFGAVRGLFGGAASRLVVADARVVSLDAGLQERGILVALAATAYHAYRDGSPPELIVGHGVLGRLLARLAVLHGGAPVVWERDPVRAGGAAGYAVLDPEADTRRNYTRICDVSGDPALLDGLIARSGRGVEIVLAGFYAERLGFSFPPAFMREVSIRIAAEWAPPDIEAVSALIADGRLSLDGLITHRQPATEADAAYRTAFGDASCVKMVLDWRGCA